MKFVKLSFVILVVAAMGGCATMVHYFGMEDKFWEDKSATIGVAIAKLPQAHTVKSGNQGLLDVAINNANASDLEKALNTVDLTTIKQLASKMTAYLTQKGFQVKQIATPIDVAKLPDTEKQNDESKGIYYAKKDFASLKSSLGVDKLVLISVNVVGTIRSYYGFIPTGDPSGYAVLKGMVINLSNNQMEWNELASETVEHDPGEWDTPPKFASLTKAMKKAYVQSQSNLFNGFIH